MSEKALIVDDDSSMQFILSQVLRGEGFEVFEEADGANALKRIENGSFDLVVMDILMPGEISARQLVGAIKDSKKDMPVIVVSAYWDANAELKKYLENRADACLRKPFDINEFRRAIRKLKGQSGAGA